jgi:hypothetical protein
MRDEACERGVPLGDFINSREYREFLKQSAPAIIKKKLRL